MCQHSFFSLILSLVTSFKLITGLVLIFLTDEPNDGSAADSGESVTQLGLIFALVTSVVINIALVIYIYRKRYSIYV